jgi:hypothetical protein
MRIGGEDGLDGRIAVVEIRHEHLDDDARIQFAHLLNGLREMFRPAVLQIVAGNSGDNNVLQIHPPRCFGNSRRFIRFKRERFRRGHGAKTAGPRAAVAGNHKRRRSLAPALPMVWALRAFANRVQLEFVQERPGAGKGIGRGQRNAQPLRQTGPGIGFGVNRRHCGMIIPASGGIKNSKFNRQRHERQCFKS